MSADGPGGTRRVFGYRQSREAGVPHLAPKSDAAVGLEVLLQQRPHLAADVDSKKAEGKRSDTIVQELRDEGKAGKYCLGFAKTPSADWGFYTYSDDKARLVQDAEFKLRVRLYQFAVIWEFDPNADDWVEVEHFPAT